MSKREKIAFLIAAVLVSILSLSSGQESEAISQTAESPISISELVVVVCHYEAIDPDVDPIEKTYMTPYTYILRDQLDEYVDHQVQKNQESIDSFDDYPSHWSGVNRQLIRVRVAMNVSLQPSADNSSIMELTPDNWEAVYVNEVKR